MACDFDVQLDRALQAVGFCCLGAFEATSEDRLPATPGGAAPRTVHVIASAGPHMWRHFSAWLSERGQDQAEPLDTWTTQVLTPIAQALDAAVVFPFEGPPYRPFQRWAARVTGTGPSPLGIYIHRRYGLWFGLRAALLSCAPRARPAPGGGDGPARSGTREGATPCLECVAQPCLSACPVAAFDASGFAPERCLAYLDEHPEDACNRRGCRARDACPVGPDWRYPAAQVAFHQRAFRRGLAARQS